MKTEIENGKAEDIPQEVRQASEKSSGKDSFSWIETTSSKTSNLIIQMS